MCQTAGAAPSVPAVPGRGSNYFSAFAVAIGLSIFLGFLNPLREPPSADFHGEWLATVFFSLAALLITPCLPTRYTVNRWLLVFPIVVLVLLVIQAAVGRYLYYQYEIFWAGYLSLAALAMILGQAIRAAGLLPEVTKRLAWALLCVAVLNAMTQAFQAVRIEEAFSPLVFRRAASVCNFYGNIGQANHAAALGWLGIAAALFLAGVGRLPRTLAMALVAFLLLGVALTSSRMAWLFMVAVGASIAFLPAWPVRSTRQRLMLVVTLIAGTIVATYGAAAVFAGFGEGCATSIDRLADSREGGITLRLELWRQAIAVWQTSPLIGVGAFNFLPTAYEIAVLDLHRPIDTYVHNALLQVLAEFGIIGFGVLVVVLLVGVKFAFSNVRRFEASETLFLAWISIIGIHSMLEFPLWYAHFLIVFAFSVGLMVRARRTARDGPALGRRSVQGLSLALVLGAGLLFYDYRSLDRLYWIEDMRVAFSAAPTADVRRLLQDTAAEVLIFRIQADHILGLSDPLTKDDLPAKIARTDRLLAHSPQPLTMARRVGLAILANDEDTARLHLRRMFAFYPRYAEKLAEMIRKIVDNRPDEFAALGPILDEELARRPPPRW